MAEVVDKGAAAIKEVARHVGKADRKIGAGQIARIEDAVAQLQKTLDFKKKMLNAPRS